MFSTAFAQAATTPAAAAAASEPSLFEKLLPLLVVFMIFYIFMIRPQGRKARDHAQLLQNLKVGDEVITSGGIIGKVRSIAEAFVTIEVSNNTSIKVIKQNIAHSAKELTPAAK